MSNPTPPPPREQRHTPEPWKYYTPSEFPGDFRISRAGGGTGRNGGYIGRLTVSHVSGHHDAGCMPPLEADAARIVACVNACAGFSSPATDVPRLIQACEDAIEALEENVSDEGGAPAWAADLHKKLYAALPPEVRP